MDVHLPGEGGEVATSNNAIIVSLRIEIVVLILMIQLKFKKYVDRMHWLYSVTGLL